jgi:hypothetical protein
VFVEGKVINELGMIKCLESNMKYLLFALVFCGLISSARAECQVELRPTDGYQDLSRKLKCVWDHVKRLEQARESVGELQSVGPSKVVVPGKLPHVVNGTKVLKNGCFDAAPNGKFEGTYIVSLAEGKSRHFCWSDGSVFLTLKSVQPTRMTYIQPDGDETYCGYNDRCNESQSAGGRVYFWPQRLVFGEGEEPRFKVRFKYVQD